MHTGPVELAAVGVSIALFNQVSRIAIFPLVSCTTSFVAEEDTIGGASPQADESESLEAGPPSDGETKEFLPQKGTILFYHSFLSGLVSIKFSWILLLWSSILLIYWKSNKMISILLIPFSRSVTGGTVHKQGLAGKSFNIVKEVHKKRHIPSASSALFIGGILGLIQAILLISAAKPLLNFMGVTSVSTFL